MAAEEVETVLGLVLTQSRGRVVFDIPIGQVEKVLRLRCINTVYLLLGHKEEYKYEGNQEQQMDALAAFVEKQLDWEKGLQVWAQVMGFKGQIYPKKNGEAENV